jgi:hypothetical protein
MVLAGLLAWPHTWLEASSGLPVSEDEAPPVPNAIPSWPVALAATTYYVDQTIGDDSHPGTEAEPWLTIQKAADTLGPGDTVLIKTGTYQERVIPQNSGSAGNYITYAAYPGHTVTVDGTGVSVSVDEGLFYLSGKGYIKISGLRIINSSQAGILADGSSHHITIEKNYTYNTGSSGIGVWGSNNIIIDGNEVTSACSGGMQESLTVAGTNTFEVKNNHVHNEISGYDKEGITVKDGSANGKVYGNRVHHTQAVGIYVDAWDKHTYNIEVFQNTVYDTANDGFTVASEMGGLLENIKIYNNIAYNNSFLGISLSRNGPVAFQPLRNIQVINNTLYNNGLSGWGGGISVGNSDVQNIVIRNNICSQNRSFQIAVEASAPPNQLTIDHNLIDGVVGEGEGGTRGNDYVEGDPKFVNSAGADFRLQANSPAIDQGSSADAPLDDFDGNPRPQDGDENGSALYDLGAFELTHLTAFPSSRTVDPGGVVTYTVRGGPVTSTLVAASPDPSLTVQLVPTSIAPSGYATLTATDSHTSPLLPSVWYNIPITATGSMTQTTSVNLLVGGAQVYLPVVLKGY